MSTFDEDAYHNGEAISPRFKVGDIVQFHPKYGLDIIRKGTCARVVDYVQAGNVTTPLVSVKGVPGRYFSFRFIPVETKKVKIKTKKVYI